METLKAEKPTELLVIGTIHQQHWAVPGYSPRVLEAMLDKANPDALCLEIRPIDVERGELHAPPEMEAVGIKWARAHRRPWYPIDWFPDPNARQEREKALKALSETPEGKAKLRRIEEFGMEKAIVDAERSWPAAMELDYRKVNSPEFSDLQRAGWDLEVSLLGDGVESLMWRPRNREMTKLIEQALTKHPGQRVAVLTGAGHKYWFDDHLAAQDGVRVLRLDDIGDIEPLIAKNRSEDMRTAVSVFLESPAASNQPESLVIEGLPEVIDAILEESPSNLGAWYSKGRLLYLLGDHAGALECYRKAASDTEFRLPPFGILLHPLATMRKGQMLDLLGRRQEAIEAYGELKKVASTDRPWGQWADGLIEKPYSRRVK